LDDFVLVCPSSQRSYFSVLTPLAYQDNDDSYVNHEFEQGDIPNSTVTSFGNAPSPSAVTTYSHTAGPTYEEILASKEFWEWYTKAVTDGVSLHDSIIQSYAYAFCTTAP
jgi:hypothetical protein